MIVMEGSEREEDEGDEDVCEGVKVHCEDSSVVPVLTRSCQNNIYYSYRAKPADIHRAAL